MIGIEEWLDLRAGSDEWYAGLVVEAQHACTTLLEAMRVDEVSEAMDDRLPEGLAAALRLVAEYPTPAPGDEAPADRAWTVVVDDPAMAREHRIEVRAPSRQLAEIEGARRAILADPRGCGWSQAKEWLREHGLSELPYHFRQEHARSIELVAGVAGYAKATAR